jgi:ribosomal protein L29
MPRTAELRELPDEELLERLESFKEELFNLRFQFATGQLDNPMRIKDVRHASKLSAHDETNDAHLGDTVRIMETRPLSKTKRWRVVEIVERAE